MVRYTEALPSGSQPMKNPAVQATVLEDGTWVVFNAQADLAQVLNVTAGLIWEHCDGSRDLEALAVALAEFYPDTPADTLRDAVTAIVREFTQVGLILTASRGDDTAAALVSVDSGTAQEH